MSSDNACGGVLAPHAVAQGFFMPLVAKLNLGTSGTKGGRFHGRAGAAKLLEPQTL